MNTRSILRGVLLCAALSAAAAAPEVAATAATAATAKAGPTKEAVHAAPRSGQHATAKTGPININTADAQALADGLEGIGLSKAQLIVAYRKEHGKFDSADQLGEVKGIGKKTLEKNRAHIVVK